MYENEWPQVIQIHQQIERAWKTETALGPKSQLKESVQFQIGNGT